jgi:hypothetical protein
MASGGIPQTPTRLSAIALGRSDVVLLNALNRSDKFLSAAEGLKCRALRGCLRNPLHVSSFQGFGLYHNITLEISAQLFGWRQVAKKWRARARSTCEGLLTIEGSIWL